MLLDETDSASLALPTVGVWVSGVTHVTHLAVWAACHRYFSSDALVDKATQRGAFLCLLFPPAPELSELEVSKSDTKVGRTARAPPPACHDVRLVEPRGASPRTHADFAATFECVPGEASVRARLAPPPATRAERNADKSVFDDKSVSRDEAEAEASADATDSSRVTLRRRASSSSKEKDASLSLSTPKPSSSILTPFSETKRQSASPDWAPVYGAAPRTAYEAAAAAAAARAAAANAKLAASRGSTPSSLLSPATLSPIKPQLSGASSVLVSLSSSFPLEGAARVVVEEQQRVIAELRNAVAFLETEMAQLTRPISAREREAQARDLLGGLEGATGFEPNGEAEDDVDGAYDSSSRGDAKGAFSSSPSPSSKSPLRKALAFARGGEATRSTGKKAAEADAAADASFRSDEVDAMYGMDTPEGSGDETTRRESGEKAAKETKASKKAAREERRAARREKKAKKAKKKSESGGDGAESLLFPNKKKKPTRAKKRRRKRRKKKKKKKTFAKRRKKTPPPPPPTPTPPRRARWRTATRRPRRSPRPALCSRRLRMAFPRSSPSPRVLSCRLSPPGGSASRRTWRAPRRRVRRASAWRTRSRGAARGTPRSRTWRTPPPATPSRTTRRTTLEATLPTRTRF
jgi:hypothetical protein